MTKRQRLIMIFLLIMSYLLVAVLILYKDFFLFQNQPLSTTDLKLHCATSKSPLQIDAKLIPHEKVLRNMSMFALVQLYFRYIESPQVTCSSVKRKGNVQDGGWQLCEDLEYAPDKNGCLVYSYGINNDFSFDDDMAKYGCEVHSFDPTMDNKTDFLRGERVYFHPRGVGGIDKQANDLVGSKDLQMLQIDTIATHRRMFKHGPKNRRLDVVKMDVEGYEFEALMTALHDGSLDDVRQLVFETHLTLNGRPLTKESYLKFLILLRKIHSKGFRIYTTLLNEACGFFNEVDQRDHFLCHEVHTVNVNIL
ncbi:hypothetical protein RRG08_041707 [Elysia crispata]|uniref:Methyltransferase domain-containing protein n=1 Tax=Elysia crispata TaxID=231223 RepID=A0AAE0Z0A5_9GAST|nr:hypothetical protein RRG08_041707 [Elysia crispata]